MSSDKYTWISTDRKTEAEVLKELVAADTPAVIVSRDDRMKRMTDTLLTSVPGSMLLEFPSTSPVRAIVKQLNLNLSFLIDSPWMASIFVDRREQQPAIRHLPDTLDDWILQRRLAGEPLHNLILATTPDSARLLRDPVRRALIPSKPNLSDFFCTQIDRLAGLELATDSVNAIAIRAGIYLWHDAMDESHELAQSIEGKGQPLNGDYVHAILHRREPDYGNAKYWFRHVGRHPNFERLGQEAGPLIEQHAPEWKARLLKSGWDPFAFVDFCDQAVATKNPEWIECAEMIQEIELLLLLDATVRHGH